MTMQDFLIDHKPRILTRLTELVLKVEADTKRISHWSPDLSHRLLAYAGRGKMIRGSLVDIGLTAFKTEPSGEDRANALILGGVMELLQTMLLIHDDIMDQDELRRGEPSVHYQYESFARRHGLQQAKHLGESLGICLGDVAGFMAFELISELRLPGETLGRILGLTSRELAYVGLAQMDDVYTGYDLAEVTEQSILNLYRFKTGRYTFSLPLLLGAILAGAKEETCAEVAELGELFGIVFQIKDDELGLFGSPEATGKPLGSDIRSNKKTLYRLRLLAAATPEEKERLVQIFGNEDLGPADIDLVLDCLTEWGIRDQVGKALESIRRQAESKLQKLEGLTEAGRATLSSVLRYNFTREW